MRPVKPAGHESGAAGEGAFVGLRVGEDVNTGAFVGRCVGDSVGAGPVVGAFVPEI